MQLETMLQSMRDRTKVTNNDGWLTRELDSALDWAWQRCYITNPDLELTFGTTGTFAADTQDFDLAANVGASSLYGLETFWIRGASEQDYTPVVFMDPDTPAFLALASVTPVQLIQPVLAAIVNFDQLRFANTLPSGTLWKADWIRKPPDLNLRTQAVTSAPEPLHQSMVAKAISIVFSVNDDSRSGEWDGRALDLLTTALKVIKRRQFQTKSTTKLYPTSPTGTAMVPRR